VDIKDKQRKEKKSNRGQQNKPKNIDIEKQPKQKQPYVNATS